MFPHSYTYNPGVVLDPVTMTPMITHGGNITVNPLGAPIRPEIKVWQKMFINNIPQEVTNQIVIRLLNEFGPIKNFKRTIDTKGVMNSFCLFDLETGQQILRIRRLFVNIKILDKTLDLVISNQTQNFLKEWMGMQKDQWRKKLNAPGNNQAKQYDTIEDYFMRDDKRYRLKIQQTLRQINIQARKLANQKMREQQRKQHHREKQRERAKRKALEDLDKTFQQKQEQVLRRQREKQKENRKQKDRQKQRQKQRIRKLQKQMNLDEEEIQRKRQRYLTQERRKALIRQEQEDIQIMLEQNPPLPQQPMMPGDLVESTQPKKVIKTVSQQIKIGEQIVAQQVVVTAPQINIQQQIKIVKQLQKNQLFEAFDKQPQKMQVQEELELKIPDLAQLQQQKQESIKKAAEQEQLNKLVPQNKMQLWEFPIDWDRLAKTTIFQRNIRPWLQQMSIQYMGTVEQVFIGLVQKKLLSRSHPDKIIKLLKKLLDNDSQQFVIRLWKKLVLQYLRLQKGLV